MRGEGVTVCVLHQKLVYYPRGESLRSAEEQRGVAPLLAPYIK